MDREEIKLFLFEKFDNKIKTCYQGLRNKYSFIINDIIQVTNYLIDDTELMERVYHIYNNLYTNPTCKICGVFVKFKGFEKGYNIYCSSKCSYKDNKVKEKRKETCLRKYGVECLLTSSIIKEKIKNTNIKKYGVDNISKLDVTKEKKKQSCIDKFGCEYVFQSSIIKEKIKNKIIEKYGVDNPLKNSEIRRKLSETIKNKFFKNNFLNYLREMKLELIETKYMGNTYKHTWNCLNCNNKFEQSWLIIQRGFLCPTCFPRRNGKSLLEKEIYEYIKDLNTSEEIITNTKKIISPYELDIYLPKQNIAIEFNGLWFHSEACSYTPIDKFYHLNKTNLCKEKNIRLIHIFEDEWLFKKEIVKNRLKNILHKNNDNVIFARKCIIKEITSQEKDDFLNKYHIQGRDVSSIKLGAFFQDQLVSVMTFSKGNIAKGSHSEEGIWELNRFCSDYNFHVIGIAGKLFTYFKRNYEWKQIFSYADRRWSEGNLYYKLGFNLLEQTTINYWYVKDYQRIHRFALRKRPDEPKDMSEWVLRQSQGYTRIWDCGNLKFIMENEESK